MQLKDTISQMLSNDPKECLKAEINQAYIRLCKLENITHRFEQDGDASILPCHINILYAQEKVLNNYFNILLTRAADEGVEIRLEPAGL